MESVHRARSHQHLWALGKQIETPSCEALPSVFGLTSLQPCCGVTKVSFPDDAGAVFRAQCRAVNITGRQKENSLPILASCIVSLDRKSTKHVLSIMYFLKSQPSPFEAETLRSTPTRHRWQLAGMKLALST